MQRAAVLAALLAGCGEVAPLPVTDAPRDPLEDIETPAPPRADEAIAIVLAFYEERTGLAPPEVRVRWTDALIPYPTGPVQGLHRGCLDIWIFLPGLATGQVVGASNTALAHELAHCVRGRLTGDPDGAHVDPAWWSDGLVTAADQVLKAAGH